MHDSWYRDLLKALAKMFFAKALWRAFVWVVGQLRD